KFYFSASMRFGGFYNGTLRQYALDMTYRAQPWGNFSLSFEQNDIQLPERYGKNLLLLISPRVEINFSTQLFWTTFFQFNTQRNNFNINSRLQWRYKPMSDFFLVYSDNYFTDPLFRNKNRAIVFKLNYWITL
ncbi:MAG: hydrolase, partial [Runella sp.]